MSKELTPVEWLNYYKKKLQSSNQTFRPNGFEIIETALKRLEEIDKIFKKYNINDNWLDAALYVIKNHFPINTEIQLKKLKALEIIKEMFEIDFYEDDGKYFVEFTSKNKPVASSSIHELKSKQEYELLKEVHL